MRGVTTCTPRPGTAGKASAKPPVASITANSAGSSAISSAAVVTCPRSASAISDGSLTRRSRSPAGSGSWTPAISSLGFASSRGTSRSASSVAP